MSAFVYRVYDADAQLLYIGSTLDVQARMSEHRLGYQHLPGGRFFWAIDHHSVTEYPTLHQARAAERLAITSEAPRCNVQGNPNYRPLPRPKVDPAVVAQLTALFGRPAEFSALEDA